jgi:hypothetical protein
MDTSDGGHGVVLIVDEFGGGGADIVDFDSIDALKDFGGRHASTVRQQLTANVFADIGMAVESHEHGGFQVEFGAFDFFFGWFVYESDEVVHDVPHEIVGLDILADHVHTE